jgi:hypothetical protein
MTTKTRKTKSAKVQGKGALEPRQAPGLHALNTMAEYLTTYGPLLGKQAERALDPLHVPGRNTLPGLGLLRQPFEAQAHVIQATAKALRRQKAVLVVAECGIGKSLISMAAVHAHAAGRPYRALVFCPGQLCAKWERELRETIRGVTVRILESWKDVVALDRRKAPAGLEWFIIARDRAKLGAKWRPAYLTRPRASGELVRCPGCGRVVVVPDKVAVDPATLLQLAALIGCTTAGLVASCRRRPILPSAWRAARATG